MLTKRCRPKSNVNFDSISRAQGIWMQGAYSIDSLGTQPRIFWPAWLMTNQPENLSKKSISTFVQLFVFLNLQNQQINVTVYKELCTSLCMKLVTKFKWAVMFPSLYRVLYHSWGAIEANENCGICSGGEEGLESTNKLVMHLCIHGAHKTSTQANLTDTFQHFV